MKKKKTITKRNTMLLIKVPEFCNHCGGAFRFFQDEVSCLMCGRRANHFCNHCLFVQNSIKKSA